MLHDQRAALEQFDRIPVQILDLDLATTPVSISLRKSRLLQFSHKVWKIDDVGTDGGT
jgi:hypothetical protein